MVVYDHITYQFKTKTEEMKNNFYYTTAYIAIPRKESDYFESILDKNDIYDYEVTVSQREYGPFGSIKCIDYCFYCIEKGEDVMSNKEITDFISKKPMTEENDGRTMFFVHDYERIGDSIGDFSLCYQYSLEVQIYC